MFRRSDLKGTGLLVLSVLFVSLLIASGSEATAQDEKLETEEIITRHLEAIGAEEARTAVRTMTAAGTTKAVFRGRGTGEAPGLVVLASDGEKNLIGMKFDNPDYPYEKMGFNGDEFTVGFISPGQRSVLGDFMRINEDSFKVGILGGVLSTGWELLSYSEEAGKLKCGSKPKKVDDGKAYKCSYRPKKGSDLDMDLYFDSTTFRHVRTEYSRVISARQGASIDQSARQNETRYRMEERFENFSDENGMMMPHTYVLSLEILSGNGTTSYEWTMDLQQFMFNNEIDPKEFKVDTY